MAAAANTARTSGLADYPSLFYGNRLQILLHLGRSSLLSDKAYISIGPDEEHGNRRCGD